MEAAVGVRLLAFEVDGVDHGIGPYGSFGCRLQGLLASFVDAIGEDNQSLAAFLLAHDLVGGEEQGVVQCVGDVALIVRRRSVSQR